MKRYIISIKEKFYPKFNSSNFSQWKSEWVNPDIQSEVKKTKQKHKHVT